MMVWIEWNDMSDIRSFIFQTSHTLWGQFSVANETIVCASGLQEETSAPGDSTKKEEEKKNF